MKGREEPRNAACAFATPAAHGRGANVGAHPRAWPGAWSWEAVHGALEALGHRDVVLVGHSYSGIVAGQAADRAGDRVANNDPSAAEAKAHEHADIDRHGGRCPRRPLADQRASYIASAGDGHGFGLVRDSPTVSFIAIDRAGAPWSPRVDPGDRLRTRSVVPK